MKAGNDMWQRLAWSLALASGLATSCAKNQDAHAQADLTVIKEISIDYQRTGWGSLEEHFSIVPAAQGKGFVLRGRYVVDRGTQLEIEDEVSPETLQAFLGEVESPVWRRSKGLQALALKIDGTALHRFQPITGEPPLPCSQDELQQLTKLHLRRTEVVDLIDGYYGQGISWTDDYPFVLVQVHRHNAPAFVMSSNSQKALMLPWDIGVPTQSPPASGENWSLPLSRSLQALLPPGSSLYKRLDGVSWMQRQIKSRVEYEVSRQCEARRAGRKQA